MCMMAAGLSANAQIVLNEGFESGSLPSSMASTNFFVTQTSGFPCTGTYAASVNVYSLLPTASLTYSNTISNGQAIALSFKYNAKPYGTSGTVSGNFVVEYSVNGGTTYLPIGNQVDLTAASASCANFTGNLAAAAVPVGADFKFRIRVNNIGTGDWYLNVDDVVLTQVASCYAPTALTSTGSTLSSASISWTAPTQAPASSYQVYYSTTNTAPTSATVLNATNSLNVTGTSATIASLTANTVYYVWVRSSCTAADKSSWSGPLAVLTGTCLPAGGTLSTSYYLNSVTTSGATTNLNYAATSYAAYVNTNTALTSYPGGVFNYSLAAAGGSTYYYYVWADLNNDLDFSDAGETIVATTSYTATNSGTITLPATLATGTYRMRTAVSYSGAITPCGPAPYGNYVDFNLVLTAAPSCVPPNTLAASNITTNSATVSWALQTPTPISYQYYLSTTNTAPTATTTPTGSNTPNGTNLTNLLPSTTYYFWVRSSCSTGTNSTWTGPLSFTTLATPPANDNCSGAIALPVGSSISQNPLTGTTIGATNTPALAASCLSTTTNVGGNVWYSVVVPASGNVTIETGPVTGSPLLDTVISVFANCNATTSLLCDDDGGVDAFSQVVMTGQTPGATLLVSVWRYGSTANATDGQFKISAYTASLGTTETSVAKNNLSVYPNPFSDVLNISDIKNVKSISVIDVAGRLVKTFEKPTATLQLSELNAGMYMVVLNMNDGTKQTIKTIKK